MYVCLIIEISCCRRSITSEAAASEPEPCNLQLAETFPSAMPQSNVLIAFPDLLCRLHTFAPTTNQKRNKVPQSKLMKRSPSYEVVIGGYII